MFKYKSQLISFVLTLLLLSPFLILLTHIDVGINLNSAELKRVLYFTSKQAVLSSALSVVLGLFMSFSILSGRLQKWREVLLILPNTLPVLLPIISLIVIFDGFNEKFPFGLWGIVFIHVLINSGIVAISFSESIKERLAKSLELAQVFSVKKIYFFKKILIPQLYGELFYLFFFVFSICFTSFSVPLMVGGYKGLTLEVLIYEKIKINGDISTALGLSIVQSLLIFLFSRLVYSKPQQRKQKSFFSNNYLANFWSNSLLVLMTLLSLSGLLIFSPLKVKSFFSHTHFMTDLKSSLLSTLQLGFSVGLVCFILFYLLFSCYQSKKLHKFVYGYMLPSTALIGFSYFILGSNTGYFAFIKYVMAFSLLVFPIVYRLFLSQSLFILSDQIQTAKVMGVKSIFIFTKIIWPQLKPRVFKACGLAAIWACGDFALSSMLMSPSKHFALFVQGIMGSYNYDLAVAMSWLLVLLSLVVYSCFWVLAYVSDKKLKI